MLSIDEALFQLGHRSGARSLETALRLPGRGLRLRAAAQRLVVITYNMALMPPFLPGAYKGPPELRGKAVEELCTRIEAVQPDIVGLCEVWWPAERKVIATRLSRLLPHTLEGPDEADFEQDGGLLLLSRHPMEETASSIYRDSSGDDSLANKGVLHARVALPGAPTLDVFYSHMQAIYNPGGKGRDALARQLLHLGAFIRAQRQPAWPALLMGDLNVPADDAVLYQHALAALGRPIDLWLAQRPTPLGGETNVHENNFYKDSLDAPGVGDDHRLDYVLLYPGLERIPVLGAMEVLRWSHDGRQISDHFGLAARFSSALAIEPSTTGTMASVEARIMSVRCLQTTSGAGSDSVSFRLAVTAQAGSVAESNAPVRGDVVAGQEYATDTASVARLAGDPGEKVTLELTGLEHDDVSGPDSLGVTTRDFPRWLLLGRQNQTYEQSMRLTGDGGEYVVTVSIRVT